MRKEIVSILIGASLMGAPMFYVTPETPVSNGSNLSKQESINVNVNEESAEIFKLKASVCTEKSSKGSMMKVTNRNSPYYGLYEEISHGDWAEVPELINFVDSDGTLYLAYSDNKYLYVEKMNNSLKDSTTFKIKKKFPMLGDVLCDADGNFYVVWGQEDTNGQGDCVTMAISKYDKTAKHLATTEFKTATSNSPLFYKQTKKPFVSGTCDSVIAKGALVTNFARLMYSGHQSNAVLAVNTEDMSVNSNYYNYVSHSLDQRIINSSRGIIYANQGDAYPRGFTIGKDNDVFFHFYGGLGLNYTYAQLGDVCEVNNTLVYSGVSAKSLGENATKEPTNLFIQLADFNSELSGSSARVGTGVTDKGVLWVTDYAENEDARNPQMVQLTETSFVLLWEKFVNERYQETYYVVMDANGKKLSDISPLDKQRLNTFEPPVLKGNDLIWVTAGSYIYTFNVINNSTYLGYAVKDGTDATFHKIDVSKYLDPNKNSNKKIIKKGTRFTSKGFKYEVTNTKKSTVKLIGTNSKKVNTLNVKSSVIYKGVTYKITAIGSKAFSKHKSLKTITIGKNVESIGSYAFYKCPKLKKVIIGKKVIKISKYAFAGNKSLISLELRGEKMKTIEKCAFKSVNPEIQIKTEKCNIKCYKKLLRKRGVSKEAKFIQR